jgi:hypothetical protein
MFLPYTLLGEGKVSPPQIVWADATNGGSPNTLSVPGGVPVGALLLVFVATENQTPGVSGGTGGWTELIADGFGTGGTANALACRTFYRVRDGSESTITITSTNANVVIGCAITGAKASSLFVDAVIATEPSAVSQAVFPAPTNDSENSLILYALAGDLDASGAFNNPAFLRTFSPNTSTDGGFVDTQSTTVNNGSWLVLRQGVTSHQGMLTPAVVSKLQTADELVLTTLLIRADLPDPIDVDVAQNLPKIGQAVTATLLPEGAAVQTLPRLTQAASGAERLTGLVAQALPKTQQAAVASERLTGSVAQVLGIVAQSAEAAERYPAVVAQITPKVAQAATGKETMRATVAQVLPTVEQVAAGEHADISVNGAVVQTLSTIDQAAFATERATAVVGQTLPTPQQAAQSEIILSGAVAQVVPKAAQAAIGSERLAGVVAQIVPKARQSADGTITYAGHAGSVAQVLAFLQQEIAAEIDTTNLAGADWIMRLRRRRRRRAA